MSFCIYYLEPCKYTNPGGVELEYLALSSFASKLGIQVVASTSEEILSSATSGDMIYIQDEGRLNKAYRDWAYKLLNRNVVIIEKNVFALPSKYRPFHKNYRMIVMSKDGAYRYRLRSLLIRNRQEKMLIVPNLPFWDRNSDSPIKNISDSRLRILRVGRPDIRKWTNFEVETLEKIFNSSGDVPVKLSLVGAPESMFELVNSRRIEVECIPYTNNVAQHYRTNDLYFHHSRIGETFGNTIFEAAEYGLFIVFVFDLKWDCAPIEYLLDLGIKNQIIEISNYLLLNEQSFKSRSDQSFNGITLNFRQKNVDLFEGNFESLEIDVPHLKQAIAYIYSLGRKFQVSIPRIAKSILIEIFREKCLQFLRRKRK